jgi:succinate dehydrogenase / fumarate reductase cytochrome b subunit
MVMVKTTFKSVIAGDVRATLYQSAIFLLLFLVIHLLGNLTIFLGPDALNVYGHKLSSNPLLKFIELYLLIGGFAHGFSGMFLSWKKRGLIEQAPTNHGLLFMSSLMVGLFVVLHVFAFRLRRDDVTVTDSDGETITDLYRLELELFANPLQVAFYVASVCALGVHLWVGWPKAVQKMTIDNKPGVVNLGRSLVIPVCVGFTACVLYAAWLAPTLQQ